MGDEQVRAACCRLARFATPACPLPAGGPVVCPVRVCRNISCSRTCASCHACSCPRASQSRCAASDAFCTGPQVRRCSGKAPDTAQTQRRQCRLQRRQPLRPGGTSLPTSDQHCYHQLQLCHASQSRCSRQRLRVQTQCQQATRAATLFSQQPAAALARLADWRDSCKAWHLQRALQRAGV